MMARPNNDVDTKTQHGEDEETPNHPLKETLESMLQAIEPPLTSKCCIFRVPENLRMIKEVAYTPRVISIGPFHHKSGERLRVMEKQKVRYLDHCIQHHKVSLDELLAFVRGAEESVRQSYGEHFELTSDDFVMMVLLDGLFIIEYLIRELDPRSKDENDNVLYTPNLRSSIRNDLILLENQLPFFVLESLYNLVLPNVSREIPFLEMSSGFFCHLKPQNEVLHFTDLLRTFHLHYSSPDMMLIHVNDETDHISSYSAKDLDESGINFKATCSECLLDIQFSADDGVFLIPQLEIYDNTESELRNIMALEQYLYMDKRYICDYAKLMDTLIDTSKDVEILVRKGVISNNIGDHEEVAELFNNLNREIMRRGDGFYFNKLNQDLDKYCERTWHKWRASLKREYFSTPWQIASVVAATILLILTLMQTIKAFC